MCTKKFLVLLDIGVQITTCKLLLVLHVNYWAYPGISLRWDPPGTGVGRLFITADCINIINDVNPL